MSFHQSLNAGASSAIVLPVIATSLPLVFNILSASSMCFAPILAPFIFLVVDDENGGFITTTEGSISPPNILFICSASSL